MKYSHHLGMRVTAVVTVVMVLFTCATGEIVQC